MGHAKKRSVVGVKRKSAEAILFEIKVSARQNKRPKIRKARAGR